MSQSFSGMDKKVRQVLTELEEARENLHSLSDDIWLNIDHNDTQAMEEGVSFKRQFNEKLLAFDQLVSSLSGLVQDFTNVPIEADPSEAHDIDNQDTAERIIRDLDRTEPYSLDEDFRYKRPYGVVFRGHAYNNLVTWKRVYTIICRILIGDDPERFLQIVTSPAFITRRGNKDFSTSRNDLRESVELASGIYAEINLSANGIRDRIIRLLKAFGIDPNECKIYLREDRNAEVL